MTFKSLVVAGALLGAATLGASAASAAVQVYTISGTTDLNGSFEFDSPGFSIGGVPGEFFTASDGTGAYAGIQVFNLNGAEIFTSLGQRIDFTSTNIPYKLDVVGGGTATIGNVGGVPEPATWAMLMLGVGLTGAVLRRSRQSAGALAAA
jgi:hypothetical protein